MCLTHEYRWLTISNCLTFTRLLVAPLVMCAIATEYWITAFLMFACAAFTDLLDGYLARLLHEQTHLGRLLDPIADKVLLVGSFGALTLYESPSFPIPHWFLLLVVVRELLLITGSLVLLCRGDGNAVQPHWWGKMTTMFQTMFIMWLFICRFMHWGPTKTYYVLLYALAIFSAMSLLYYGKHGKLWLFH